MDKINVWLENKCSLQFCIQDFKEGGWKFLKSSRALVRRNCQIITLLSKLTQHGELGAFRFVYHFMLALIPESPGEDAEDLVGGNFCYLGPDDDAKSLDVAHCNKKFDN